MIVTALIFIVGILIVIGFLATCWNVGKGIKNIADKDKNKK